MVTRPGRAPALARGLTTPSSRIPRHLRRFFWLRGLVWSVAARGRGRGPAPQRGADLRYDMSLTFEEASAVCATKIKLAAPGILRIVQRHRARKRVPAFKPARAAGGPRPACLSTRILHHHAHVPCVSRRRTNCERSVAPIAAGKAVWSAKRPSSCVFPRAWTQVRGCGSPAKASPGPIGGPAGDLYVVLEVKEASLLRTAGRRRPLLH